MQRQGRPICAPAATASSSAGWTLWVRIRCRLTVLLVGSGYGADRPFWSGQDTVQINRSAGLCGSGYEQIDRSAGWIQWDSPSKQGLDAK